MGTKGDPSYNFRDRRVQVLVRNREQTSTQEVWFEGALVVPTVEGSSYSLYSRSGTVEILNKAISVVGDVATATIEAEDIPESVAYDDRFTEEWTLVINGTEYKTRRSCILSPTPLRCPVIQQDILDINPQILEDLINYDSNLQRWIDSAWTEVLRHLIRKNEWPDRIVDPSSLFDPVRETALYRIYSFLALDTQRGERYVEARDAHNLAMRQALTEITYRVDTDFDNADDDPTRRRTLATVIHRNQPPIQGYGRYYGRGAGWHSWMDGY